MNKTMKSLAALAAITLSSAAQSTLFNIDTVAGGSSGFGASSFHDASGSNPMSGTNLANITLGSGMFGTYDDMTGELHVVNLLINEGGSFTIDGILLFDGSGLLAANSQVDIDFTGSTLSDTTIGYLPGYICCGSTAFDPNSFMLDGNGQMVMTLWGADYINEDGSADFLGDYSGSALGMDLRLKMTEADVPEPSILALLSLGLFGLFMAGRNKKV